MHADREVVHDPECHPAPDGAGLRVGQLLVELPLQPAVEVHRTRPPPDELGDVHAGRMLQSGRPAPPVTAVLLGQCAPGGEVVEGGALSVPVRLVGQFPSGGPAHLVNHLQRGTLGGPGAVAVDDGRLAFLGADGVAQFPDLAALGEGGELRDRLDPQIQRTDESPRGRQIRRWLHRSRRRRGMQRIHQDVVGAVLRARPHREVGEIGEIADAPGPLGLHAVELGGQTPPAPGAHPGRHPEEGRGDDQRHVRGVLAGSQVQAVVAEWQVGRQDEGRLAHQIAVQIERRGEVLALADVAALGSVRQPDPDVRGSTVRDMRPERALTAGGGHHGRWQRLGPVPAILFQMCCGTVLFGVGLDAERGQHRDDRRVVDGDEVADPVVVGGRDPHPLGQGAQRRCCHGCHLARLKRRRRAR